ncbi:MAG: GEVED domain-containing protein [Planctomycetaceae bacterium]|nr:GEVED domain-containing protein [Planctomycetaceae bacterium]
MKKNICLILILCLSSLVYADWNQGDTYKMHFPQYPQIDNGWDVCLCCQSLADDFLCTETGTIDDIHIWVSFQGDIPVDLGDPSIWDITIRAYDLVSPGNIGPILWSYTGGSIAIRQWSSGIQGWYCPSPPSLQIPNDHQGVWQINFTNLYEPMVQTQGQMYWLVIKVNLPFQPPPAVGWKTANLMTYPPPYTGLIYGANARWQMPGASAWNPIIPLQTTTRDLAFVITGNHIEDIIDYGDAPDGPYPTLLANNGARHVMNSGMFLGLCVDSEPDGQPTIPADGDDINPLMGPDDEDGVVFSPFFIGQSATVNVTASAPGFLDAWIDFNGDGMWTMGLPEQIAISTPLVVGNNAITFNVPATALLGQTYARFRFSGVGGLMPTGLAPNGEVEDYAVMIEEEINPDPNTKYVQWPDTTPTGIDIRVDDGDGVTRHIADDFPCKKAGPITDIHFWGSWKNDEKSRINGFTISFYSDDPVGLGGSDPENIYSKPDQPLWKRTFLPGEFDESLYYTLPRGLYEWWWDPYFGAILSNGDQNIWQYDIYIDPADAFVQEGTPENPMVYWLEIEAWTPYQTIGNEFGWKTSDTHWNDDAVFATGSLYPYVSDWSELRYPEGHPYYPESLDMAFKLTTGEHKQYKWLQKPDLSETGIDVDATEPFILADDFQCNKPNLITKIVVWGSWLNDILPAEGAGNVTFTLSIHEDIPDPNLENPLDYSMPAEPVWLRNFLPGQFEVEVEKYEINEGWWSPDNPQGYIFPGDHVCWKYTFHIPADEAFYQKGTPANPKVYWLDVQAHPFEMTAARFGWKTSLKHWNDDAVWGMGIEPYMGPWHELIYPPQHQYYPESIDLAFAIDSNNAGPKADLGDAPDSTNNSGVIMTTYPSGVTANFPTVYMDATVAPPFGPLHQDTQSAFYLGTTVSFEKEADMGPDMDATNNIIPATNSKNLDGGDDGVAVPLSMPRCRLMNFNYTVTVIDITQPIFANVWFDFNRDGDWDDVNMCGTDSAPEWAVVDQFLTFSAPGTYTVSTPAFRTWHPLADDSPIWMRITLSETPSMPSGAGGSGPLGGYQYGETEDYHFWADQSCSNCADYDLSGLVNYLDLREFVADWLWTGLAGGYAEGDLDCDGDVEFTDFAIFAEQWYLSCP